MYRTPAYGHILSRIGLPLLISALVIGGGIALSQDKPSPEPFCNGSTPGACEPIDVPAIELIPPDEPIEVRLRRQLAKERQQHRVALRECRAGR